MTNLKSDGENQCIVNLWCNLSVSASCLPDYGWFAKSADCRYSTCLLVALVTLVVFQMLGGITGFYRSWRGVRAATEFALLLRFAGEADITA